MARGRKKKKKENYFYHENTTPEYDGIKEFECVARRHEHTFFKRRLAQGRKKNQKKRTIVSMKIYLSHEIKGFEIVIQEKTPSRRIA